MALSKIQASSMNLADTYAFTGTVSGTGGITEIDQWRLTANKTSTGDITTDLERIDSDGGGTLGTGMTVSSGIWTFPSTGIWLVELNELSDNTVVANMWTTTDGSTFGIATNTYADSSIQSGNSKFIFDVTDTSLCKVKFSYSSGTGTLYGSTNHNQTHFTFIRLADT